MAKYLDNNGLLYFWQKVKNYIDTAISGAGGHITRTASLSASGWSLSSGYYYQTITVAGVTATNIVIVDCDENNIKCTAQAANSLTFRSTEQPAATVKIVITT